MKFGLVLAILCTLGAIASAGDTNWQHDPATSGDWHDAGNWTNGVPAAADHAYIDNGGTALITADMPSSVVSYVGNDGQGAVVQSAGTWPSAVVYIGNNAGSVGTFELTGSAVLQGYVRLGRHGQGSFVQSSGTVTASMRLGSYDDGYGHYLLQSGHLDVPSSAVDLDINTNGMFEQTGGTSYAAYVHIGYGESGGGTFRLTGGTHTTSRVYVGTDNKPRRAEFELGGTGRLEAGAIWVGRFGPGRFVQNSGDAVVSDEVEVGTGSLGTYELHGGVLSAPLVQVGREHDPNIWGRFVQTGGRLAAERVMLNPMSRYEVTGGQMALRGGMVCEGTFDFIAPGGTLEVIAGTTLDLGRATITHAANGRINAEANTLMLFPAGFDPHTDLAAYASAGVTHVAGTTMTVPADQHLVAIGRIDGHVRCHGSLRVPAPGDRLDITGGLEVMSGASVGLGDGTVTISDTVSGMTGAELTAGKLVVAPTGTASFTHSAGTTALEYGLTLGQEAGSEGTLAVTGGEVVSPGLCSVGYEGTGRVVHSGGKVTFTDETHRFVVGARSGSSGVYELSGTGVLELTATADIGYIGAGRFVQDGGTVIAARGITVGFRSSGEGVYELSRGRLETYGMGVGTSDGSLGGGTVIQSGGENIVTGAIGISAQGSYVLSGAGRIEADNIGVGWYGGGALFRQDGGTTVVGALEVAKRYPGTYELNGGVLHAGEVKVAEDQYYPPGPGLLRQTGGSNTVGYLSIGTLGRYELSGGDLYIDRLWRHEGEMDLIGSGVAVSVGDDSVADLRAGSILNGQNASLTVGARSLTLLPSGFDPGNFFGTFSSAGLVHYGGTTLTIPAGYNLLLDGTFEDHVIGEGSLSATPDGDLNLTSGLEVRPGGSVDLRMGELRVDDEVSGMTGGQLRADTECVGYAGTGRFVQSAGSNTMEWYLMVGAEPASEGTYELHGSGQLSSYQLHVGTEGVGRVVQTDGICSVDSFLYLGKESGRGSYELEGGQVLAERIYVGGWGGYGGWDGYGDGRWTQTGGSAACEFLYVLGFGNESSLELSGGDMTARNLRVTGTASAVVTHTDGMLRLTGSDYYGVQLADRSGQIGEYRLAGTGVLITVNIFVGYRGSGRFVQTGGDCLVGDKFIVGFRGGASGSYELGAGLLRASTEYIGYFGLGRFIQDGGTNDVLRDLYIGWEEGSGPGEGAYQLRGGTLSCPSVYVAYEGPGTFVQSGGLHAAGSLTIGPRGSYEYVGGTLQVRHRLNVDGALALSAGGRKISVGDSLRLGPGSSFSAVPDATIRMTGAAFVNQSTDPAALAGLSNLTLIFEGGAADVDPFEAAGMDMGPVMDGLVDNFALAGLTLGGIDIGQVQLVSNFDNQPGWVGPEALYVYDLKAGPGSYLDLNGLNLYYLTAEINPAATIVLNGGSLMQIPEPATLALLAIGGLALFRRRKRHALS